MSALSPRQMFLLDEACKPIHDAFCTAKTEKGIPSGLYLVGTAMDRGPYRDVDVRLMLNDKRYDRLCKTFGQNTVNFLGLAIGEYLASRTGLPIDFQFQRITEANENHHGARNPLGTRRLRSYAGDAQRKPADAEHRGHHVSDVPFCVDPGWVRSIVIPNTDGTGFRILEWQPGVMGFEHRCDRGERGVIICAPLLQLNKGGHVIVQADPLTISPSILCGDCGTHGFVRDGRWVQA